MFKKKPKEGELKRKTVEQLVAEASSKLDQVLDNPKKRNSVDVENSLPDPIISLARETIENTIPPLPDDAIISKEFDTLDEVSGVYDKEEIFSQASDPKEEDSELPPLPSATELKGLSFGSKNQNLKAPQNLVNGNLEEKSEIEDFEVLDHENIEQVFVPGEEIQIDENLDPLANIVNEIDRGNFSDAFESDYRRSLSTKIKVLENILYLVNQKSDFRLMMTEILEIIVQAIPSEAGSIIEVDYRKGDMFFSASKGTSSEKLKKLRLPKNAGIAGFVVESGESYCTNRADDDTIHLDQISKSVGFHVKNIVCIPIKIQGRVFGVLELINKMGTENYDNEDVSTLNDIMTYISIVIENKLLLLKLNKSIENNMKSESKTGKAA